MLFWRACHAQVALHLVCNINSGQKRLHGVPAKSAADSVSQGGFPLGHQILKRAWAPSKIGIKPFWGGGPRPAGGRGVGTQPAGFFAGGRALLVIVLTVLAQNYPACPKKMNEAGRSRSFPARPYLLSTVPESVVQYSFDRRNEGF